MINCSDHASTALKNFNELVLPMYYHEYLSTTNEPQHDAPFYVVLNRLFNMVQNNVFIYLHAL